MKKNSNNSSNISTLKILENENELLRMKSQMNIELDKILDLPSKKRIPTINDEVTDVILGVKDQDRHNRNAKNIGKKLITKFELDDHVGDIIIGKQPNKQVEIKHEGKFIGGRKQNYDRHLKSKIEIKYAEERENINDTSSATGLNKRIHLYKHNEIFKNDLSHRENTPQSMNTSKISNQSLKYKQLRNHSSLGSIFN